MKIKLLIALLLSICMSRIGAEDKVPCLIFSGSNPKEKALPLENFNRVSFGETAMTVSKSGDQTSIETLSYSDFNRITIGESVPSLIESVNVIRATLFYDTMTQSLCLSSSEEDIYSVSLFSLDGSLITVSQIVQGESINLRGLKKGVYLAIANNENVNLTLKFVKQ